VYADHGGGLQVALALRVAASAYLSLLLSALPAVGFLYLTRYAILHVGNIIILKNCEQEIYSTVVLFIKLV
jgi:hypothetical protein